MSSTRQVERIESWVFVTSRLRASHCERRTTRRMMSFRVALATACAVHAAPLLAQAAPLTRTDAVRSALTQGARLGVARADSLLASAQVALARTRPNPALSLSYTRSFPTYHALVDIPL